MNKYIVFCEDHIDITVGKLYELDNNLSFTDDVGVKRFASSIFYMKNWWLNYNDQVYYLHGGD